MKIIISQFAEKQLEGISDCPKNPVRIGEFE